MKSLSALAVLTACAWGQTPSEPPPLLQLVRKPGIGRPVARQYANARAAINVIGMVSVTGVPETWLVESHYSFGSIEDLDHGISSLEPVRATDAGDPFADDVLAPARTMIAIHRPTWSYRPVDAMRSLPKARYYNVTVYRIRAGTEAEFTELIRLRRATAESVNLDRPELAYQIISGAPSGTFVFLAPMPSLRSLDNGSAPTTTYAEAIAAERASEGPKLASEADLSRERLIFRVDPRISYVSDEFADGDAAFWRGRTRSR